MHYSLIIAYILIKMKFLDSLTCDKLKCHIHNYFVFSAITWVLNVPASLHNICIKCYLKKKTETVD